MSKKKIEPTVQVIENATRDDIQPGDHVTWAPTPDSSPERDDWYRPGPGYTLTVRRPVASKEESK